jgi:hypothetical protein
VGLDPDSTGRCRVFDHFTYETLEILPRTDQRNDGTVAGLERVEGRILADSRGRRAVLVGQVAEGAGLRCAFEVEVKFRLGQA